MKSRKMTKLLALSIASLMATAIMPTSLIASAASVTSASQSGKVYADYATQAEAKAAADKLNKQINEEGTILLKNENGALPAAPAYENVSVFGYSSESIQGAAGVTSLAQALSNVGFNVNPTLKSFYAGNKYNATDAKNGQGRGEISAFSGAVERSIQNYSDIAFVTITRYGKEGTGAGDHKTVLNGQGSGADYSSDASGKVELANDKEENIGGWEHEALYTDENGTYKHELMLTNEEVDLLNYVKGLKQQGVVKKIVYVLNSVVPVEMYNLENDEDVDGILMISRPGQGGLEGVANVIAGKANPSGKTNQIYVRDMTADPIWYNVGTNCQTNADWTGSKSDATNSKITYSYVNAEGEVVTTKNAAYEYAYTGDSKTAASQTTQKNGIFGTDYEEDIYRDYWYYETVAEEMNKVEPGSGDAWYAEHVVYPFGYGLSYGADFEYEVQSVKLNNGAEIALNGNTVLKAEDLASAVGNPAEIKSGVVTVKVTNKGSVAGKEAVQLYSQAAYNKVETPHVRLIAFEKTTELLPGASQTLKIEFNFQDMAAYDWSGKASNGLEKGYVLEQGDFTLHVMGNSNGWMEQGNDYEAVSFEVDNNAYLHLDDFTDNAIENKFSPENGTFSALRGTEYGTFAWNADSTAKMTLLSRSDFDGTFPQAPTKADMTITMEAMNKVSYWNKFNIGSGVVAFDEVMYLDEVNGTSWNGLADHPTPADFAGVRYQDGQDVWSKDGKIVAAGTEGATKIVDGATDFPWIADFEANKSVMKDWTQAAVGTTAKSETQLVAMSGVNPYDGAEGTKAWNEYMNQLTYAEMEHMAQRGQTSKYERIGLNTALSGYDGSNKAGSYTWASNGMVASTWNKDLVEKQGIIAGNLSIFLKQNAWWGGGAQLIRSVWAGRNGEFMSTDPMLTGFMAAEQNKGVASKGIPVHIKHGILNDQTAPANTAMITWISEQAIRELYTKSFQMAIQEGGANAFMASYARVGIIYSGVNYQLLTGLIRNEWGGDSVNVTTDNHVQVGHFTPGDLMARAGVNDMNTSNYKGMSGTWNDEKQTVTYAAPFVAPTAESTLLSAEEIGQLQWFLARRNAVVFVNTRINSKMGQNGVDATAWEAKTFELTQGTEASEVSVAGEIKGADEVVYTATNLPAGLTLETNGAISGTPTVPGKYEVTITATVAGWINNTQKFTLNVASGFEFPTEDDAKANVGEEYFAFVLFGEEDTEATFKATGLPEGLTMSETGDIEGIPTVPGTYTVTVTATIKSQSGGNQGGGNWGGGGWGGWALSNDVATAAVTAGSYSDTFVLTVEGEVEVPPVVVDHGGIVSIEKTATEGLVDTYTITFADGYTMTYTVTNGANGEKGETGETGAQGPQGEKGETGAQGPQGEKGKDGVNGKDGADALAALGCSGSIAGITSLVALAVVGGALTLRKKED